MKEPFDDHAPRPLPREWLPEPRPSEGAPVWDARTRTIMAAADPELRRLRHRRAVGGAAWWSVLGPWWKPAAALATAATALLLLVGRPAASPVPPPGAIPLSLVASAGDPAALWESFGIRADPVLALIAVLEPADVTEPVAPATIPQEEHR